MTSQELVPDFTHCQALKEKGFEQEGSCFVWAKAKDELSSGLWYVYKSSEVYESHFEVIAAPTVSEMVEWLNINKSDYLKISITNDGFQYYVLLIDEKPHEENEFIAEKLADAIANACIGILGGSMNCIICGAGKTNIKVTSHGKDVYYCVECLKKKDKVFADKFLDIHEHPWKYKENKND